MAENLVWPPTSETMSTAASPHPERGTPLRERNACNGDSVIEHRVSGNMHCVVDVHACNHSQPGARTVQFSVVNVTDPPVNLARASNEDPNVGSLFLRLWAWIYTKVIPMLSAGIFPASKWCHYVFHCTPDEGVGEQGRQEYSIRWEKALRSIACSWKDIKSITTSLLLVSALTVLQLDDILNNRAICTLMAASILLALASILSSFVYLLSKERFISRWKASEGPETSFWRCISMPLDFAIWSFIFFISTIFMLIYERMLPTRADATIPQPANNSPQPMGAAFV